MALIPPIIIFWGPTNSCGSCRTSLPRHALSSDLGPATVFFTAFYLFQGTMDIFTPTGQRRLVPGFPTGMMRPQLFSASLLLGLILITAGLAVLRLDLERLSIFILSGITRRSRCSARISLEGWSPANLLLGIGVAIAGWPRRSIFISFRPIPRHGGQSAKTLYMFCLNQATSIKSTRP